MKELIKTKTGVTMMALIVTIIVMVILAGTVSTLAIINVKEVKHRIKYNSISIAGNGTTENYIKATNEILDIVDIKYDGDLVTYISLKDLKIVGTVNRKYSI